MTNQNASSVFGGAGVLADSIVKLVRSIAPVELLDQAEDPQDTLKKFSRQRLLDFFTKNSIPIDQVMPVDWSSHNREEWLEKMAVVNPDAGGVGASGHPAPEHLLLDNYVRWEALHEVCGPNIKIVDEGRAKQMQDLRKKYSQV